MNLSINVFIGSPYHLQPPRRVTLLLVNNTIIYYVHINVCTYVHISIKKKYELANPKLDRHTYLQPYNVPQITNLHSKSPTY